MISFLAPWLLAALPLAGVPFILHLMSRESPLRLEFPSVRFVPASRLPRHGRRRPRDLLLLALRTLLLLLLVLAFAQPVWHREPDAGGAGLEHEQVMIVLDASASMSADGVWQEALDAALDVLDRAGNAAVGLVIGAHRPLTVLPPGTAPASLREAIRSASPTTAQGSPRDAVRAAFESMAPGVSSALVAISDFQLPDWQFPSPLSLPETCELRVVEVGSPVPNAGIAGVATQPLADGAVRVLATVRNWGLDHETRTVVVDTSAGPVSQALELPPLTSRRAVLVIPAVAAGALRVYLKEPDGYAHDDRYWAWVGPRPPVRVLAVGAFADQRPAVEALFFLRKALEARGEDEERAFEVDSVNAELLAVADLSVFGVLLLIGEPATLDARDLETVKGFVAEGGTLLCFPAATPGLQFRTLGEMGLLGGVYETVVDVQQEADAIPAAVDGVEPGSRLAEVFGPRSDLYTFPIYRYVKLAQAPPEQVVLRNDRGDPLLLQARHGRGEALTFTIGGDSSWSELPITTAFVPLLREVLLEHTERDPVRRLVCGETLPGTDRDGTAAEVMEPGAFSREGLPVEVNVSRRESTSERIAAAAVQRLLGMERGSVRPGDGDGADGGSAVRAVDRPLRALLLLAALLVFCLEAVAVAVSDRREVRNA